jgi:ATP/maltotriose-dependent transcriptional regulator MalT
LQALANRGDQEEALRWARTSTRALPLSTRLQFMHAILSMDAGRLEEAAAPLAEALERSVRTGDRWSRTELHAFEAQVRLRSGDLPGARAALVESEATLRETDVAAVAVVEGVRGEVFAAEGRDDDAEAAFRRALAAGRATEYCWWIWDGLSLAEFLLSRGRVAEARAEIVEVDVAVRACGYGLRRARMDAVLEQAARSPA